MNHKHSKAAKILSVKKNERKYPLESFQEVIRPCLTSSQCLGVMPVSGLSSHNPDQYEFKWKSAKVVYAVIFLIFGTIDSCTGIRRLFRLGFNFYFAESLLFFVSAMARAFLIFRIALNWPEIMKRWRECEKSFLYQPYAENPGWKLRTLVRWNFFVVAFVSLGNLMKT